MSDARRATIMVGVDGSAESLVAATWAAQEAVRRHLSLLMTLSINEPVDGRMDDCPRCWSDRWPCTSPHTRILRSQVIPPTVHLSPTEPSGPILVGVDGHPDARAAVGFAFDEAAVRETGLLAVLVFDDLAYRGFAKGANLIGRLDDGEEHAVLAEQLAGWSGKYPDVPVQQIVLRGQQPARALLRYTNDRNSLGRPRLIAVGTHGRSGLAGLLFGSTSQYLISHADLPVIVVRPETER